MNIPQLRSSKNQLADSDKKIFEVMNDPFARQKRKIKKNREQYSRERKTRYGI